MEITLSWRNFYLFWSLMTSYDLSGPHGTSADQPHVTLAKLMGPMQPFCDLSRPLITSVNLRWLNSYVSFGQMRSYCRRSAEVKRCHMRSTKVIWVQLRLQEDSWGQRRAAKVTGGHMSSTEVNWDRLRSQEVVEITICHMRSNKVIWAQLGSQEIG